METAGHIAHRNRHWLCCAVLDAHGAGTMDGVSVPKGEAETKRETLLRYDLLSRIPYTSIYTQLVQK